MSLAVGYARVSTEEQASEGVSLEAQEARVRAYCRAHGLEVADLVVADESAKNLDRQGLRAALAALDSADVLVVARLDRLTRSVADWCELLRSPFGPDPQSARQLHTAADGRLDTVTATGRLLLNIRVAISQWERETIVERTREALDHKRARGDRTGGVPYGWDLDPDSPLNKAGRPTGLVPNDAEQAVVARIRELASAGMKPRAIAAELTAAGVPTKRGLGPWAHSAVAKILGRDRTTRQESPNP